MRDEERAGKCGGKMCVEPTILPTVGVGSSGPSAGEMTTGVGERKHGASHMNNAIAVHGFEIHIPGNTGRKLDRIGGVCPRSVGADTADGGDFVESRVHMSA